MRVTITTEGGFTGRGIGSAAAEIADHVIAHLQQIETWRDEYDAPGADLVRYTMTIGARRVRWREGAELPASLRELFELVWKEKGTG
ncbi:MAG TPA: hypothetical protein VF846_04855 [Thermoanaerobaculia bacterium]|jgi:exoribonuclease II